MDGHLCLKWNNHSTSFLKSIGSIQTKERYCDATITCQGKFFPVHRIVLSTCSDYFEAIFERIQNQHPYIVFKDIEPKEMELLLNYMYQGEVNVLQENLPSLIKAAEALRIKGLAVPDDLPSKDQPSSRKRSNTFSDSQSKRRAEERRRKGDSIENNDRQSFPGEDSHKHATARDIDNTNEPRIKEEPLDTGYEDNTFPLTTSNVSKDSALENRGSEFVNFIESDNSPHVKNENLTEDDSYDNKPASWGESSFESGDQLESLSSANLQEDIYGTTQSPSTDTEMDSEFNATFGGNPTFKSILNLDHVSSYGLGPKYFPFQKPNPKFVGHRTSAYSEHPEGKMYSCSMCSVQFAQKQNLLIHTRIHTGERPYKCPHCGSKFRHSNSLRRHLNRKVQCIKQMNLNHNQQM